TAVLGAAGALGIRALVDRGGAKAALPARPKSVQPQAAPVSVLLKSNDGQTLNVTAFWLIRAHDYRQAIPFARKAVRKTSSGSLTHGYATFNLGYALLEVGRCGESLSY